MEWKQTKLLVYFKSVDIKTVCTYSELVDDCDGIDIFTARRIIRELQKETNIEVLNWKVG